MNKEINELDRMTIGVREWAIERVLNWEDVTMKREGMDTILKTASRLEEHVLRGLVGKIAHCWATGSTQDGGLES